MKKILVFLCAVLLFFGTAGIAKASSVTLPDLLVANVTDFSKAWGPATEISRTDISGAGVLFNISGLGGSGSGWKDDYMLSSLAGGTGGHNADFSAYNSYTECFQNQSTASVDVQLFMNTGFTGASGTPTNTWQNDTFWAGGWVTIGAGETVLATLDFSNAEAWNIADDPTFTGLTDGAHYPIFKLYEVSAIGFEVADFGGGTEGAAISLLVGAPCPNPVPEPATLLLLGSGLVGLAGFRRKFRK